MKRIALLVLGISLFIGGASAQVVYNFKSKSVNQDSIKVGNAFVRHDILNHLNIGINLGSSGVGIEVQSSITKYVGVRAGIDYMPRFNSAIDFGLQAYKGDGSFNTDLDRMQEFMKTLTGYEVDQEVSIIGQPTMLNFKFLVDIYPWADKPWHVTAGFYCGSAKIATAVNSIVEMPTLLAVGIYNQFYDKSMSDYFIDNPIFGNNYLSPDVVMQLRDRMESMGRMGIHMGDYEIYDENGKRTLFLYMMEPGDDGLVKADVFVNKFKPYVGIGYNGFLPKNKKIKIGFDLGVMMWGGTPKVITHDGVDLARDVINVKGRVGDYVDVISAFKVYPVLNFKISYNIF